MLGRRSKCYEIVGEARGYRNSGNGGQRLPAASTQSSVSKSDLASVHSNSFNFSASPSSSPSRSAQNSPNKRRQQPLQRQRQQQPPQLPAQQHHNAFEVRGNNNVRRSLRPPPRPKMGVPMMTSTPLHLKHDFNRSVSIQKNFLWPILKTNTI